MSVYGAPLLQYAVLMLLYGVSIPLYGGPRELSSSRLLPTAEFGTSMPYALAPRVPWAATKSAC